MRESAQCAESPIVAKIFVQFQVEHGDDHSNDNDDNHHAHTHPSANDDHHDPHNSHNIDQNNHVHDHDQDPDQLQNDPPSNDTTISINSIRHNQLNDNHDHDDNDNDGNKDDDSSTPTPFPERRLFCIQSDKHQCFQPNFTVATSKKPLRFSSPSNSTVIVFVTQKMALSDLTIHLCFKEYSCGQFNPKPQSNPGAHFGKSKVSNFMRSHRYSRAQFITNEFISSKFT